MSILYKYAHPLVAVGLQVVLGLITGNFWLGALAGCAIFIGREHAQAEYRWIEWFGGQKRANMPWWGGFDPKVWDKHSLLGFALPIVGSVVLAAVLS
jgi:hypothetical protein